MSTATSTDIAVDIAVDSTYSKHDPVNVQRHLSEASASTQKQLFLTEPSTKALSGETKVNISKVTIILTTSYFTSYIYQMLLIVFSTIDGWG